VLILCPGLIREPRFQFQIAKTVARAVAGDLVFRFRFPLASSQPSHFLEKKLAGPLQVGAMKKPSTLALGFSVNP
jgi:hypothetical protein